MVTLNSILLLLLIKLRHGFLSLCKWLTTLWILASAFGILLNSKHFFSAKFNVHMPYTEHAQKIQPINSPNDIGTIGCGSKQLSFRKSHVQIKYLYDFKTFSAMCSIGISKVANTKLWSAHLKSMIRVRYPFTWCCNIHISIVIWCNRATTLWNFCFVSTQNLRSYLQSMNDWAQ